MTFKRSFKGRWKRTVCCKVTLIISDPGQKKKKKDQEGECKKEDQDSKAIEKNQAQYFDKDLFDIQLILLMDRPNQQNLMRHQEMKEAGQKRV
jgi:hypothetical protein